MNLALVDPIEPEWKSLLKKNKHKEIAQIPFNAYVFLKFHPDFAGFIRWNRVTLRVEISGGVLAGASNVNDLDNVITKAQDYLASELDLNIGRDEVGRRLSYIAEENGYDPLQNWLNSIVWDHGLRLDNWLITYAKAKATSDNYVNFIGRKWILSCVARAFQPGCKADAVLIAEGEQGWNKSTMFNILGGAWYSEASGVIGDKDSKQLIGAAWICELPDMSSFSRTNRNTMKAFFSSAVDRYRPPYGRSTIAVPRRAVFAATTNAEAYLDDPTGNRRFWPVHLAEIDRAALIKDRDQLFAEAVAIYKAAYTCSACLATPVVVPGEIGRCDEHGWWLTPAQKITSKVHAHLRDEQDVWASDVLQFAYNPVPKFNASSEILPITTGNILKHALDCKDIIRVGAREGMRIADILKRAGFRRENRGADSIWLPPEPTPPSP